MSIANKEKAEQRRIARELGIDLNDLSLQPSNKDMSKLSTPQRRQIQSSKLQAAVYPDSDLEDHNNSSMNDSLSRALVGGQESLSHMSTPRRQTYN